MDVKTILDKIGEDARAAAADILEDAKQKAHIIRAESQKRINDKHALNRQRMAQDGEETEKRMLRMAELEDKKSDLAQKRQVLSSAFEQAAEQLRGMPAEAIRDYFLKQAISLAQGNETLLAGQNTKHVIDNAFVADVNAALTKEKGQGNLALGEDLVPGTGFVLRQGGTEINCTFEALVDAMRLQAETDVANILFS